MECQFEAGDPQLADSVVQEQSESEQKMKDKILVEVLHTHSENKMLKL